MQNALISGSKSGAFVKPIPSPSFANLANLQNAAAYSPSFGLPFMMPWIMSVSTLPTRFSNPTVVVGKCLPPNLQAVIAVGDCVEAFKSFQSSVSGARFVSESVL